MKSELPLFKPSGQPLKVLIVVFDQTNALSLASLVDPLRAANRRAGKRLFDWSFATPTGAPARLTAGIDIPGPALPDAADTDLLVVVASFQIADQITPRLVTALRNKAHRAQGVAAADGGAWLLARAGLLDGYAATSHWEDHDDFTTAFPNVETRRTRYVIDRNRLTTAGAAPSLDMMLDLISRRHGAALAARVASVFIYDPVKDGSALQTPVAPSALARRDPLVARVIARMADTIEAPQSIAALAKSTGLTPRSLENRFAKAVGTTPKAYYLSLRLAEAQRLATETANPVQDIAFATGFSSQAAFARAFKAAFGQSVTSLRRQI